MFLFKFIVFINNFIISKFKKNLNPDNIIFLGSRCLQFNECRELVVKDINNCKLCGRCPVKDLLELKKEYGIKDVLLVTGGGAARKFVKKTKIKLVIAVACERELALGILGVLPNPSYGVYLRKDNGPCTNTSVSKEELRNVLKHFL